MHKFIIPQIKPEQSVRKGSDPHHAVLCLMHARRHKHRPLDAFLPHIRVNRQLTHMVLTSIDQRESLIEGCRQDISVHQRQTVRRESEVSGNSLYSMHLVILRGNVGHHLTHRSNPDTSSLILRNRNGHKHRPISVKPEVIIHSLAADKAHIAGEPHPVITVNEYMGDVYILSRRVVECTAKIYLLEEFRRCII